MITNLKAGHSHAAQSNPIQSIYGSNSCLTPQQLYRKSGIGRIRPDAAQLLYVGDLEKYTKRKTLLGQLTDYTVCA